MEWLSVYLLTFMVTVKYSSNQMNKMIFWFKITPLLIVHLAKCRFYRPLTVNTDILQTQKCKKVCITDPLGNSGTRYNRSFHLCIVCVSVFWLVRICYANRMKRKQQIIYWKIWCTQIYYKVQFGLHQRMFFYSIPPLLYLRAPPNFSEHPLTFPSTTKIFRVPHILLRALLQMLHTPK